MNANPQSESVSGYRAGSAYGELADALAGCRPGEASITYAEGDPADPGHALEWMPRWAKAPSVTWEASGLTGEFDLSDFMAIVAGLEEGHPFAVTVHSDNGLPFVAYHPSGQLQAVRYDAFEEKFKRRILYATASEPCAFQLAQQGAEII